LTSLKVNWYKTPPLKISLSSVILKSWIFVWVQLSMRIGIKQERENPFEIKGKQALFVVNLPEQKMAGEYPKVCCLILATPIS